MKKLFSTLVPAALILSMAIIPSAAAERKSIMSFDNYELVRDFGLNQHNNYITEYMFDGNREYNKNDASSYCHPTPETTQTPAAEDNGVSAGLICRCSSCGRHCDRSPAQEEIISRPQGAAPIGAAPFCTDVRIRPMLTRNRIYDRIV